jgi:hypothetical protein
LHVYRASIRSRRIERERGKTPRCGPACRENADDWRAPDGDDRRNTRPYEGPCRRER